MTGTSNLWGRKNETLSDKSAEKEYGLSHEEILKAITSGELQFKEGSMHGNPWFRLLRSEVESLVVKKHGVRFLKEKKASKELSEVNKELKTLYSRVSELEKRKKELLFNHKD